MPAPFKAIVALLACCFLAGPASASDSIWMVRVTVQTEAQTGPSQEITGFKHRWTFDEIYSEFAVAGLDTNGDGIYSEEELRPLAQTNIKALKDYKYLTFAFLGKKALKLKDPPPDYCLEHKNKRLTLTFSLPLATPVPRAKIKDFNFEIYDPSRVVAIESDKQAPVKIVSMKPHPCRPHIIDYSSSGSLDLAYRQSVTFDCT